MNKKNIVTSVILIVLAPILLFTLTFLGNKVSGKNNTNKDTNQTEVSQKVPEEKKQNVNNETPKADDNKASNSKDTKVSESNLNTETKKEDTTSEDNSKRKPIKGKDYIIQAGDTLFVIASTAYGENKAQAGIEKIKEANGMKDNNIVAGQKITIPDM